MPWTATWQDGVTCPPDRYANAWRKRTIVGEWKAVGIQVGNRAVRVRERIDFRCNDGAGSVIRTSSNLLVFLRTEG